jgi:hypothetical protein
MTGGRTFTERISGDLRALNEQCAAVSRGIEELTRFLSPANPGARTNPKGPSDATGSTTPTPLVDVSPLTNTAWPDLGLVAAQILPAAVANLDAAAQTIQRELSDTRQTVASLAELLNDTLGDVCEHVEAFEAAVDAAAEFAETGLVDDLEEILDTNLEDALSGLQEAAGEMPQLVGEATRSLEDIQQLLGSVIETYQQAKPAIDYIQTFS